MKSSTIWQILVLTGILTKHSSQAATKACPTESTKNTNFPVVHMCNDRDVSGVQGLFLDAFVSANSSTNCTCSLRTRQYLQIDISNLSFQCYSPNEISTTSPSTTSPSTSSSVSSATSLTTTTNVSSVSSTHPERSSSVLVSSESMSTVITEKTNSPPDSPVAAAIGGVTGAVLIVAVVAVVIITYIRTKRTPDKQNTDDEGDYVNSDVNSNNDAVNVNSFNSNNVNPYNTDGNTYEHLQHNTVQYVNTSSSVDGDHVYLHVSEPTQARAEDPKTSAHVYYNTVKND
ncbi:chitinase 3-like isoform X2 [Gigantopelta aegis]|uniref:chitinase 3-like isoform X2 n=1 Tax=Gigantopelta aegis TaxID=1735272 RepID=UPI001B88BE4C|nr:chitinase 3-like isoform X2 [Gigantopelta aegis]